MIVRQGRPAITLALILAASLACSLPSAAPTEAPPEPPLAETSPSESFWPRRRAPYRPHSWPPFRRLPPSPTSPGLPSPDPSRAS